MITIYKASAGSGKTFTLALRYISLLIGYRSKSTGKWLLDDLSAKAPGRHRSILAVTFTNKATAEMKGRIIKTLSELSSDKCSPEDPYMKKLLEIFSPCSPADISLRARRVLMQLLFDFGSFNVSTIDSFFQTVLRTFARELNLPDNYQVQLDQREVIDNAVHDMLDVINSNSPYFPDFPDSDNKAHKARLREWILSYMESMMTDGNAFNLFNRATSTFMSLAERLSLLFNETYKLNADKIDAWFEADSGTRVVKLREALKKRSAQLRQDIVGRTSGLLDRVSPLGDKVVSRNLMAALKCWVDGNPADGKTPVSAAQGEPKACVYAAHAGNTALVADIASVCAGNLADQEQMKYVDFLLRNLYPLGLFGEMRRHLERYCRDENMVLQSSTNDFLSRIISDESETPFIYERLGMRLHHFLLDEFQDTSRMQWNILRPLILESLSNGNDNLIIGDGKQSIYGFRNTDYRLLNHIVAEEIAERQFEIDPRGTGKDENVNYRSAHDIVKFNNALFDAIPSVYDLTPADTGVSVYDGAVQELAGQTEKTPGYVDLAFMSAGAGGRNDDAEEDAPDFDSFALDRMLHGIVRQLRSGYHPRDIAILVRTRSEGELAVKHLINAMATPVWDGLPEVQVMSSDALLVGESPLVKMLVAKLRMMLAPEEAAVPADEKVTARLYARRRDLARFVDRFHTHLFADVDNPSGAVMEAVEESSPRLSRDNAPDSELVDPMLATAPTTNLLTMAERIVRDTVAELYPDGNDAAQVASVHNIYLTGFMDLVAEYMNRHGNDLRGFLEWWDTKRAKAALTIPADVDAINVLTIHKAKGLEYPCVHVPFIDFKMTLTSNMYQRSYRWYKSAPVQGVDKELLPPFLPLENKNDLSSLPEPIASQFKEFIDGQYIDNINLLYVALTRPTRELVASAFIGAREETVGDALYKGVLAANMETSLKYDLAGMLSPDDLTLTIGFPTAPAGEKHAETSAVMPGYVTRDNSRILKITSIDSTRIRDWVDPASRARVMRRVMEQTISTGDVDIAVNRVIHQARLPHGCAGEILGIIKNAMEHTPESFGWFDGRGRVAVRQEILAGNMPNIKRWRPDRIVWRADGFVDVVEYVFDNDDAAHISTLGGKVRNCMKALVGMGNTNIRGFLWNLDTGKLTRLTITP